jgi:mannose-6-phosphate isomerase-like protein (cupin superfamily)
MFLKRMADCAEFLANDGCRIRELLHSKNDPIDLPYSLALCTVEPGGKTYQHYLRQAEVYLIIKGHGRAHVGEDIVEIATGDAVVIPPKVIQWIENTGADELLFAAIVSPPWRAEDDVRLPEIHV